MKVALSNKRLLVELTDSGEAFKVVEGLLSDLPDGLVRVEGDVRRDDDVVHRGQLLKFRVVLVSLLGHVLEHECLLAFEDVQGHAEDLSGPEAVDEVRSVDDLAARRVDDDHVLAHLGDRFLDGERGLGHRW